MLDRGVNADEAFMAGVDLVTLNCALGFGVVKTDLDGFIAFERYGFQRRADGGVCLATDGRPIPGHEVTIKIPRASLPDTAVETDTLSALITFLLADREARKTEAEAEALRLDPSLRDDAKALESLLYLARRGARLPPNFPPGAPRKNP
jgi:hypothetical protein